MINNNQVYIRKSNDFVLARYRMPILGNKILALSLTKLEEEGNQVKSVLHSTEIRRVLSAYDDVNLYKKLKTISRQLAGSVITTEDGKGNFKTFSICTNAEYVDQTLTLYYNKEMKPLITKLKNNYTTYELATLVNFTKNYTYRLYELLKKEAWKIGNNPNGYTTVRYNLNELKAIIGLINTDANYIQKAISSQKYTWDEIVENIAKKEDRQFDRFGDFKTRVLEEAKKEIQESDIRFDYSLEKGDHGKVKSILFMISYNVMPEAASEKVEKTAEIIDSVNPEFVQQEKEYYKDAEIVDMDSIHKGAASVEAYDRMKKYILDCGIKNIKPFTIEYYTTLLELADGDPNVIFRQIDCSKQGKTIKNFYGWLKSAVKNRYSDNVVTVEQSVESNTDNEGVSEDFKQKTWNKFKEKDYFDDFLEYVGIPIDVLEITYSADEKIQMITSYIRKEAPAK